MMTYEDAKKLGTEACLGRLGKDFVREHRDMACSAYSDEEDHAYCFVGVSDQPEAVWDGEDIILDGHPGTEWSFQVSCNVWYADGNIEFLDCVLPDLASA